MWILPLVLFLLLVAAIAGAVPHRLFTTDSTVQAEPIAATTGATTTLFVTVHGMEPNPAYWNAITNELTPHGAVLRLSYRSNLSSNANPADIARNIAEKIGNAVAAGGVERVVLVAHSMGAVLSRRALLLARDEPWAQRIERVVLLAGVSRGWDIVGEPPPDSSTLHRLWMRLGYWLARLFGSGELTFSFERGSPFIADLRLEWMRWLQDLPADRRFEVVQMLGDIDDIVRREDNEDLRAMAVGRFVLLRVRGTGHGDILDFGTDAGPRDNRRTLGKYRRDKFVTAATAGFDTLKRLNEELPPATDPQITEVIFVLHGIRDLGRWSANFERQIEARYPQRRAQLAIVSPRYGYFGMGPFLFEDMRQRHVRWFMDTYTETLARYPNVRPEKIRFFGHSNGTYLLAKALLDYKSMAVGQIVFAGSVVRKDYPWQSLQGRVERVRNYVATDDWVVALFPRLFEIAPFNRLGNDIGSAGFNGFAQAAAGAAGPQVENVKFVRGAHGAFEDRVDEIVGFLLDDGPPAPARLDPRKVVGVGTVVGLTPVVLIVWTMLAAALIFVAIRVVASAATPAWPVLLLFLLLVVRILQTV